MKLEKHFLPSDISKASEEYWCTMDLLKDIMERLQKGDLEIAKHRSIDLLKSIQELSKMSEEKHQSDRMDNMINQLNASGVHIEVVRRHFLDRKNS